MVNSIQNNRALWQSKMLTQQIKMMGVDAGTSVNKVADANRVAGSGRVAGAGEAGRMAGQQSNKRNEIVAKANELVNQLFYGTLMREFRNSQQPTMLDSGPGATAFVRQLDMELVKKMSQQSVGSVGGNGSVGSSNELVKALVKEMCGRNR